MQGNTIFAMEIELSFKTKTVVMIHERTVDGGKRRLLLLHQNKPRWT
jgi:hypothetical protein